MLLGLDVGGTKCAAVLADVSGETPAILARRGWPSRAERGPVAMIADLVENATALAREHGKASAAGVAIGGPLDALHGIIDSPPNLPGWMSVPLRSILEEKLGLPVRVEHDAAACALAEQRWGEVKGSSRLVYLTCGTGFGAGIVIDGEPYYGAGGRTSEIGHVRLRPDGPVAFGRAGTAEALCSARGLERIARWKFPDRFPESIRAEEIADLAAKGDADAEAVIALNAEATGEACSVVADLFVPDVILLGTLARRLGPRWVSAVRASFERCRRPEAACEIRAAALGERLQDLSAIAAATRASHNHKEGT